MVFDNVDGHHKYVHLWRGVRLVLHRKLRILDMGDIYHVRSVSYSVRTICHTCLLDCGLFKEIFLKWGNGCSSPQIV